MKVTNKSCTFLQVYWNIHGHNQHLHQNFDYYGVLQHTKEVDQLSSIKCLSAGTVYNNINNVTCSYNLWLHIFGLRFVSRERLGIAVS